MKEGITFYCRFVFYEDDDDFFKWRLKTTDFECMEWLYLKLYV